MQQNDLVSLSESKDWDKKWNDIFEHYQDDLRNAYYMHAILHPYNDEKVLEIGAGSFRDMAELRRRGIDCEGGDFSEEAVRLAKIKFTEFSHSIYKMNAFELPHTNNFFDISYHNGLWGYFDDVQIKKLLSEQVRVTRKKVVATVHNAHNNQFVNYFSEMKVSDPLFDIRFFTIDKMIELMEEYCSDIQIIPVGKGKKYYEDLLINNNETDPQKIKEIFSQNRLKYLESSERLMCIGILN